jgi:hypothetical protein
MGQTWLNKLAPFDARINKPVGLPNGGEATEYTTTSIDPISSKFMVHPQIWFNEGGEPVYLKGEDSVMAALYYELESGKKFPRFNDEESANDFAANRSSTGGAKSGLLALMKSMGKP